MHKSGCGVCGKPLIYNTEYATNTCYYCEKSFQANIYCPDGHYICDDCHRFDANDFITKKCLSFKGLDPVLLANGIMNESIINIHGPEHHYLVPAVLLTVYANYTNRSRELRKWLKTIRERMVKIPGAICSTHGSCGAILGLSAFVSLITGTTSLSEKEWSFVHTVTAEGMQSVAKYGGPRCCKRDTYIAILQGVSLLRENFNIELERPDRIFCEFSLLNKECIGQKCLFYLSNKED